MSETPEMEQLYEAAAALTEARIKRVMNDTPKTREALSRAGGALCSAAYNYSAANLRYLAAELGHAVEQVMTERPATFTDGDDGDDGGGGE